MMVFISETNQKLSVVNHASKGSSKAFVHTNSGADEINRLADYNFMARVDKLIV